MSSINAKTEKNMFVIWFEFRARVLASCLSKKYAQQLHYDSVQSVSEPELKLTPYTGNCCKESFEMKMCHLVNGHEYIRQGRYLVVYDPNQVFGIMEMKPKSSFDMGIGAGMIIGFLESN